MIVCVLTVFEGTFHIDAYCNSLMGMKLIAGSNISSNL